MKKIFIHIGTQKAGSTTIQTFSSVNNGELLDSGIFYPMIGRKPPFISEEENIIINGAFLREKNYRELLNLHLDCFEKSKCHTMILSEEGLTAAGPISNYNLKVYLELDKYDVKVIVYLRRASDYLASFWQECIRNKHLVDDLNLFMVTHQYKESLNKIHEISKIIGNKNIIIRTFEKERWVNNNLVDDFLSVLSVKNSNAFTQLPQTLNKGMSRQKTDKLAFLNQYLHSHNLENKYDINDSFLNDNNSYEPEKIINSVPDDVIKLSSAIYYPVECEIAKNYIGREELFLNKYPNIYGKKRPAHKPLAKDTQELLIGFIEKQPLPS